MNTKKIIILALLLLIFSILPAKATKKAVMKKVISGDTYLVKYKKRIYRFKLKGMDCYSASNSLQSKRQANEYKLSKAEIIKHGAIAKKYINKKIKTGSTFEIEIAQEKRLQKKIYGYIYLKDNVSIHELLLKNGYCKQSPRNYYKSKKYKKVFDKKEKKAQKLQKGIWKNNNVY